MCVLLSTCVRHAVHVRPVPHQYVHHPVFASHGGAPERRNVVDGPEIFLRMSNNFPQVSSNLPVILDLVQSSLFKVGITSTDQVLDNFNISLLARHK